MVSVCPKKDNRAGEKCLEHKRGEEQLRELLVFNLKKRSSEGNIKTLYSHLNGGCSQVGTGLFSQVTDEDTASSYT